MESSEHPHHPTLGKTSYQKSWNAICVKRDVTWVALATCFFVVFHILRKKRMKYITQCPCLQTLVIYRILLSVLLLFPQQTLPSAEEQELVCETQ